ncbi:hypothetical protein [Gaiella sp.]|uniref:hypothetical protein n=1 Tax=Gaiella sp. TaxID=2663207 RepID=UPI003983D88C
MDASLRTRLFVGEATQAAALTGQQEAVSLEKLAEFRETDEDFGKCRIVAIRKQETTLLVVVWFEARAKLVIWEQCGTVSK